MKHWVTSDSAPVVVYVYINPIFDDCGLLKLDEGGKVISKPQAVRRIVESEGDGGANNVSSIALRDLSFGSPDYHDFLTLGLNSIFVQIDYDGGTASSEQRMSTYILKGIAIE